VYNSFENIGNDTVHYLEIFKTDTYGDISLNQWLALTPPNIVKVCIITMLESNLSTFVVYVGYR
jgi:oxalate decarboxylase/phosphoglucose isomerase-like protein (cupin superfamily)